MFESVEFESEGATLRGRYYQVRGGPAVSPVVVMAHGFSATITMTTDRYAEVFAAAGLAVLLYDHRNFGGSGGGPRFEVNPWLQARGYRDGTGAGHLIRDVRVAGADVLDAHGPAGLHRTRRAPTPDRSRAADCTVTAWCKTRGTTAMSMSPTRGNPTLGLNEPNAKLTNDAPKLRAYAPSG